MAKKNTLLQDAIADAKAVRETALANARAVLEEAFTPHLTSMLSAKLQEEEAGETGWEGEGSGGEYTTAPKPQNEDMTLSSSDIGGKLNVDSPAPKEPAQSAQTSSDIENKGQEQKPMEGTPKISEGQFGEEDGEGGEGQEAMPSTADADGSGNNVWARGESEFGEGDLDLEAIIRELEGEAQAGEEEVPGAAAPAAAPAAAQGAPVSPEVPAAPDGPAPAVPSVDAPVDADSTPAEEDDNEHNINLEAILREMDLEEVEAKKFEEVSTLKSQLAEVAGELKEYRQAVQILRSKLQEVNLLNAKLLYTNKLFKNYNMSGPQKMKVVETFDRTNTVREVKLVFSTLAESFNSSGTVTKKKSLTESIASKAVASTKPAETVKESTVITEGSEMATRFQKLAGIKK